MQLPTGTVTFLFTDVEGSTRLLQRLGDGYGAVQDDHARIMRRAIDEGGGVAIGTEGDSFFAVFADHAGAVRAAVSAQRALAAHAWPHGVRLRVRMGLHTGRGELGGDGYLGIDVNRTARIAAAGHGGQVLLSEATRSLVWHDLPGGVSIRDLGEHRLKDLEHPVRIYELVIGGLPSEFAPLKTLEVPSTLPSPLTSFVGRQRETQRVAELVSTNRLVTLTGPGGAGKTRLAVEVARTLTGPGGAGKTRLALQVAAEALPGFGDGVFFVDLSAVAIPELVPAAIAAALDVREDPGRPLIDRLGDYLRDKELLLVVDNFEQVADAAPSVLEPLLGAAPALTVLVTSRVPLHLYGEQEFPVPPLALPDPERLPDLEALAQFEAVALFAERAAGTKPDFRLTADNAPAVAEITTRLDGLPLAIELAASRVRLLPPQALLARLDQRLPLLSSRVRNVPERQRTLRRTIEWSYELLDEPEQQMFCRLAVFAGGAQLEAVEAAVNPQGELGLDTLDGLATLVDNNLIQSVETPEGESRFSMLETIREYGLERLSQSGEEWAARRRHAEHWIEVVEQAFEALSGPEQATWTRRLERELDNFRSALSWALQSGETELGLRLAAALRDFWRLGSHFREGMRWLRELLALPAAAANTLLRARALTTAADLVSWKGETEAYLRFAEEAVSSYRDSGDPHGLPDALSELGVAQMQVGRLNAARATLHEARELNIGLGNLHRAGECNVALGMLALVKTQPDRAREHFEDALETFTHLSDTYWGAFTERLVGQVDMIEGNHESAEKRYRESLSAFRRIDSVIGTAWGLYALADLALTRGQHERALRLAGASEAIRQRVGEASPLEVAVVGDVGRAARSFLDDATAEGLYQQGRAMELEDAVAYALQQGR